MLSKKLISILKPQKSEISEGHQNLKRILRKQHYGIIGRHSAVQICRWTKKSLRDEGGCYKEKFYGIKSHSCCQMSPSAVFCQNKCVHCWRAIEHTSGNKMLKEVDNPKEIIKGCTEKQKELLSGFKGNLKVNLKKLKEAQEPMQFAISLIGEPTLYPKLGELIGELRKKGKTSFLVTNGLQPSVLKKLDKERNLPTQLYISLNSPNEKHYNKWHRSSVKNAWKRFKDSLRVMSKLKGKTRTVIRMTLVKEMNMKSEFVKDYVRLIKKAKPDFIEVKGFMSVGFSRKRLSYEMMPTFEEIRDFADRIAMALNNYKILDKHKFSRVVLIGKNKGKMKIKKNEI